MCLLLVGLDEMKSVGDRLVTVWVSVCDSVAKGSVMPMDEEGRAVSVMVGRPELSEDGTVGVSVSRVPMVPELTRGMEMAVVDKVTVGWLFKEVRLGVLREEGMVAMVSGCVVTILLVSEVSREDEVAVAEVSIVLVAKVEVDGGKREGE